MEQQNSAEEKKERQRRELPAPLIYRERDLDAVTRMSRKAREDAIREGTFPKPFPLSTRARGWLVSEIEEWLEQRVALRDRAAA